MKFSLILEGYFQTTLLVLLISLTMLSFFFPRLDFHFPWEAVGRSQYRMVLYQHNKYIYIYTTTQYCIESSLAAITHL